MISLEGLLKREGKIIAIESLDHQSYTHSMQLEKCDQGKRPHRMITHVFLHNGYLGIGTNKRSDQNSIFMYTIHGQDTLKSTQENVVCTILESNFTENYALHTSPSANFLNSLLICKNDHSLCIFEQCTYCAKKDCKDTRCARHYFSKELRDSTLFTTKTDTANKPNLKTLLKRSWYGYWLPMIRHYVPRVSVMAIITFYFLYCKPITYANGLFYIHI